MMGKKFVKLLLLFDAFLVERKGGGKGVWWVNRRFDQLPNFESRKRGLKG